MNRAETRLLAVLTMLSLGCTAFADQLPGKWWQWLIYSLILLVATVLSTELPKEDE